MLFITGSESFIGKKLIQRCKEKNIKYFGIDSKSKKSKNSKKIDIRSKNIGNYIPKRSTIIHLAAISKDSECNSNPSLCMNININGTLNLIKAAQKRMIKNFIFASSEWVYGDSRSKLQDENSKLQIKKNFSLYAMTKIILENFLINTKPFKNINILRFGIIYGGEKKQNWSAVEGLFHKILNSNIISIGSKNTSRNYIHLDDLINGILLSTRSKGINIYNLTGDKKITLKRIIDLSLKDNKKKIKIIEKDPNNPSIRNISNLKAKKNLKWKIFMKIEKYFKNLHTKVMSYEKN